jgi:hypothetical protein
VNTALAGATGVTGWLLPLVAMLVLVVLRLPGTPPQHAPR